MGVMVWYCHGGYNGGDVLDLERPCWFFFFSLFPFLCQRLRERDEKEKREREIIKKRIFK